MGVKFSQLPTATTIDPSNDYLAVLDTSENTLKKCTANKVGGGLSITQAQWEALTPEQKSSGTYYITDAPEGGSVTIDSALSTTSTNAVENAVITNEINHIKNDIGTFEPTSVAAYSHAVGEYFMWVGQFVKVTAAIAVGDTIATGVNVAATSVSAILSELNSNKADTAFIGNYDLYYADDSAFLNAIFSDIRRLFPERKTYNAVITYSRSGIYVGTMAFMNTSDSEYHISILAHMYNHVTVHFGTNNGTTFYRLLCSNYSLNWTPALKEGSAGAINSVRESCCKRVGDLVFVSARMDVTCLAGQYMVIQAPVVEGNLSVSGQFSDRNSVLIYMELDKIVVYPQIDLSNARISFAFTYPVNV